MIKIVACALLSCASWLCAATAPPAALPEKKPDAGKVLKVGVYLEAPFVMKEADGKMSGFCIDLWEMIAQAEGWKWEYVETPALPQLIDDVAAGKTDIAVTDLFITRGRSEKVDFSHPYFDAGLQIMINEKRSPGFLDLMRGMSDAGHLEIFGIVAAAIALLTILITLYDRAYDPVFPKGWVAGLAESFYHVMSIAMTGKASHKGLPGPFGRVMAALWLVCGVGVVAYITSSVTSVMTANRILYQINNTEDLPDKRVGTIAGSVAETYCRDKGWDVYLFRNIDEAVGALVKNGIDAIVYDSPILTYYDFKHPKLPIREVGPVFEQRKYGFPLTIGSPYRRIINEELLMLSENESLSHLKETYFGTSQ